MKHLPLTFGLLLFNLSGSHADQPALEVEPSVEKPIDGEPAQKKDAEPKPSVLTFSDETRISGFPKKIEGAKQLLTLDSDSLSGETILKTNRLLEMTLDGTPEKLDSDHYAIATLKKHYNQTYNDSIRGRLIKLDDKTITLDTWYAGRLTLRRSLVKSLDIYNQSPTFFEGPNGPAGWVNASGKLEDNWTFKDRAMISKGSSGIAREIDIPKKSKITFTATWKNSPYFRILIFADNGNRSYSSTGYNLNIQQSYLSLYRSTSNGRNSDIVSESIRSLYNTETATFTIYLDRNKEGTSAIYIDDTEIGTWAGVDDTELKGKWLHFVPQNSNAIRFSQISVAQWDGILPSKSKKDEKEDEQEKPKVQEIRLANGDVIVGNVKAIDKGIASLTTTFGDVPVPVKVMRSVDLVTKEDEVRMQTNDVRAWFHEGGYITLKLKSLEDKTLKGYSQAWGDAEFDLNAFSRIEFNIWRPELDAARYGTETDW